MWWFVVALYKEEKFNLNYLGQQKKFSRRIEYVIKSKNNKPGGLKGICWS